MRLGTASLIGLLLCTVQTRADELPSRKPGLWEVRQIIGNAKSSPLVIKQCIDAATDRLLQSSTGPYSADLCPTRSVQKSADAMTIELDLHHRWQDGENPRGHLRQLRQRLQDDGHIARRGRARQRHNLIARGQMARALRRGPETGRSGHGQRHEAQHPGRAEGGRHTTRPDALEPDPEKWIPVFGKDHAQTISKSVMTLRRKVITL